MTKWWKHPQSCFSCIDQRTFLSDVIPSSERHTFITKHLVGTILCVSGSPGSDRILFLSSRANRPVWILIRKNPNNFSMKLLLWSFPRREKKNSFYKNSLEKVQQKLFPAWFLLTVNTSHQIWDVFPALGKKKEGKLMHWSLMYKGTGGKHAHPDAIKVGSFERVDSICSQQSCLINLRMGICFF